jgi:hypothetical protein
MPDKPPPSGVLDVKRNEPKPNNYIKTPRQRHQTGAERPSKRRASGTNRKIDVFE